ncbi:LysR family transcriptional regulator [Vibrio sp. S4M6]|uniref:LysR family transcriptional regulator n=1 Tax=Vibrio sinus TaxID=2946865 RepID=UPI00202A6863|nr:LysR family transcriptional regulator [Vibrio sinus]MCL9780278.1 LysR family transcriptional regulator [Vibrio sinus]
MDWIQSVQTYLKVVEEKSFNGAARKLNTTSSAVSKRIHWLEERIGAQLLKRTTRSVTQTEAGALFYLRAKDQLDGWQSVVDETRSVNQTPVGLLKIGATLAVGSKFLVQYLNDFLLKYPDIRIQLTTTTPGQLPELSLDVIISREVEQINSLSFIATPLYDYKAGFYVSPTYIDRFGCPETVEELQSHNVLIWGERPQREIRLSQGKRIMLSGNFFTTNPEAIFYAAKHGLGILLSGDMMIRDELSQGILTRILPDVTADEAVVYAYYPKLDYKHTRTHLFLNYLKERMKENPPL